MRRGRADLLLGLSLALGGVALVSLLIELLEPQLHTKNTSMLYLIVVLAVASRFGHWPAIPASLAAFFTFNWFFVEPRQTLLVSDPQEWVTLLVFLLTAIITGGLAAGQRRRADESAQREREAFVLYDTARAFGSAEFERALRDTADQLRADLSLSAIAIDVATGPGSKPFRAAAGDESLLPPAELVGAARFRVLGQPPGRNASVRAPRTRWVRAVPGGAAVPPLHVSERLHVVPISSGDRRVGSLLLVPGEGRPDFSQVENHLLSTVAAQLGQGIEGTRLREEANNAEVLRRTDELRTALLNTISHDLRTPLASIIASAGSLRQRDVSWSDEQVQQFAVEIEQEARRLNRIVGNLLDLSRIEAGSLRPDRQWHDVGALVDDVLRRLRPLLTTHPTVVDVPDELPPVWIDYVELDEVLSNLVENAAKYSSRGAAIRIEAVARTDEVEIRVVDEGKGFSSDELRHAFDPFYRGDSRPQGTGTGLGLAVAKGLVEAHGGRIWVEARPARGSVVAFALPLSRPGSVPEVTDPPRATVAS